MSSKKLAFGMENIENGGNMFLLDLPEADLDCILKRLSPTELCRMSEVSISFRDRFGSDHLWEKHIKHKWGRVIGEAAYKEWQWHIRTAKEGKLLNQRTNQNGSLGSFSGAWPNLYLGSYLEDCKHLNGQLSNNFMKALYFSLESGRFWFPAQFYKRLTIHNALVSYDSKSDTFQARQQYGGWRFLGKNIQWDMLRAPPVETPPYALHVSDCLDNLKPGDHIEIQWRGRTETPYAWWYAVIGHLESCNENKNYCQCHYSEMLIVDFKQYPQGSYMRRVVLNRKHYEEQGNRAAGYYGGIRKLQSEEDIERWKKHFPPQTQVAPALYYLPPMEAQVQIL